MKYSFRMNSLQAINEHRLEYLYTNHIKIFFEYHFDKFKFLDTVRSLLN